MGWQNIVREVDESILEHARERQPARPASAPAQPGSPTRLRQPAVAPSNTKPVGVAPEAEPTIAAVIRGTGRVLLLSREAMLRPA